MNISELSPLKDQDAECVLNSFGSVQSGHLRLENWAVGQRLSQFPVLIGLEVPSLSHAFHGCQEHLLYRKILLTPNHCGFHSPMVSCRLNHFNPMPRLLRFPSFIEHLTWVGRFGDLYVQVMFNLHLG